VKREDAFARAEYAIRTGVPVHPRAYREMREALGELSVEEESILASHRAAREFDEACAERDRVVLREAADRFLAAMASEEERG